MSHPALIAQHLDGEEVVATINLSGEDSLVITPTRALHYESEGILSDESVTEYPHDVSSVAVETSRRKVTLALSYPIDGTKRLSIPKDRLDTVLHYILAGVFHVKSITRPGETVRSVFQFNELTVVITSDQLISHVGSLVWDEEFDEYQYEALTGLTFQEGSIATEIVLYVDGRSQRIKVPNARAAEVKQALETAVIEYFDVDSLTAFNELVADDTPTSDTATGTDIGFDGAFQPLGTEQVEADVAGESSEVSSLNDWPYDLDMEDEPVIDLAEFEATIESLQDAIDEQRRVLDSQEAVLADLIELLPEE